MAIEFHCGNCGKFLKTTDDKAGRQGKCPDCRADVVVPAPAQLDREHDLHFESASEESHSWYDRIESVEDYEEPQSSEHPFAARERSQICPMCGAENVPTAAQCSHCGEELPAALNLSQYNEDGNVLIFSQILNQTVSRFESNIGLCISGVLLTLITMVAAIVVFYLGLLIVGIGLFGVFRNPRGPGIALPTIFFLGILAISVFNCWLILGLNQFLLKLARFGRASIADLYSVTLPMVGSMALNTFVFGILAAGVVFGTMIFIGIGLAIAPIIAALAACAGFILYLMLILSQWCYPYVIIDRNPSGLDPMTKTFRLMSGNYLTMFLVLLCLGVLNLIGAILFGIGLLFTIPFGMLMLAVAYDQMTHSESI